MPKQDSIFSDEILIPSPIQEFSWTKSINTDVTLEPPEHRLFCKRDDLIHPIISGNKWRKLQGVLSTIGRTGQKHVLSFGGGYSNHLHALAYLCFKLNIQFTAIIRGNYGQNKTPMINDIEAWGTSIKYVTKMEYKSRNDSRYLAQLQDEYDNPLIVPEGGSSQLCFEGMDTLLAELTEQLTSQVSGENDHEYSHNYIILPVASAGTLSGLIKALHKTPNSQSNFFRYERDNTCYTDPILSGKNTTIIGVAVLKGVGYLEKLTNDLLENTSYSGSVNWEIEHSYFFGGYAKSSDSLNSFILDFNNGDIIQSHDFEQKSLSLSQKNIKVEHVYSGKVFFALYDLLKNKRFQPNSRIIILHTGGMQGAR